MAAPVNCLIPKMTKMSHKKFRAHLKKLRRKRIRQTMAKGLAEKSNCDDSDYEEEEFLSYARASLLANKELVKENEEQERERLHVEWLQKEAIAQEEFQIQKSKEERLKREREEKEREIREEWETLQKKEDAKKKRLEDEAQEKKDREAALLNEVTQNVKGEGQWCNPTAPADYGSELDKQNCTFFLKTGVCRFGDRCSRAHPRLPFSCTLLIPGMFTNFGMEKSNCEYDSDISLEYEDKDCRQQFREFSEDVLPEFKKFGKVVQFKVCKNQERHLRGNVYVQFEKEEEAMKAFQMFNGRYYAGKILSCTFTSITKWKPAICGLNQYSLCPKGNSCNFLHVFNDPSGEFRFADRDLSPVRDRRDHRSYRSSRRQSSRSPSSSYSRRRSLSRDRSSRSSRYSTRSTRRSRSRDRQESERRVRRRSRRRSFEDRQRHRYRRTRSRSADTDRRHRHSRSPSIDDKRRKKNHKSSSSTSRPDSLKDSGLKPDENGVACRDQEGNNEKTANKKLPEFEKSSSEKQRSKKSSNRLPKKLKLKNKKSAIRTRSSSSSSTSSSSSSSSVSWTSDK